MAKNNDQVSREELAQRGHVLPAEAFDVVHPADAAEKPSPDMAPAIEDDRPSAKKSGPTPLENKAKK